MCRAHVRVYIYIYNYGRDRGIKDLRLRPFPDSIHHKHNIYIHLYIVSVRFIPLLGVQ